MKSSAAPNSLMTARSITLRPLLRTRLSPETERERGGTRPQVLGMALGVLVYVSSISGLGVQGHPTGLGGSCGCKADATEVLEFVSYYTNQWGNHGGTGIWHGLDLHSGGL
jgi:hypothetical protein